MSGAAGRLCTQALGLVCLALGGPAHADVVDRVAAIVNDDVVTLSEVYELGGDFIDKRVAALPDADIARREAEIEVLDTLILRALIDQEMARLGMQVTDAELDRSIDDMAARNDIDRAQLRLEIEKQDITWADYREEMRTNLAQYKFSEVLIRPRIAVDDNELLDAYKRRYAPEALPKRTRLGALFFQIPPGADDAAVAVVVAKANAARARVEGGEDFAAVAAEVDEGLYGAQGGVMGVFKPGELVGPLDDAATGLEVGALSDPVVTPQGVFVLTPLERITETAPAFEEVKETLFQEVYSSRIEDETDRWYREMRRKSAVLIRLETPGG